MAWNRPNENLRQPKKKPPRQLNLVLVVATAVVAMAAAVWFILAPDPYDTVESNTAKPTTTATRKQRNKPIERRVVAKTGEKVADALAEVESIEPLKIAPVPVTSKLKGLRLKRPFKSGVEQVLSWVFCIEPGEMPVPVPGLGEEDRKNLTEILISKNEIEDGDTPAVAAMKETVDYAKKEMIKFIKDGGDPDDFIRYYHRELNKAFEIRNEAISQAAGLKDEDPALAKAFIEKVNQKFATDGIKPLDLREFQFDVAADATPPNVNEGQ